MTLEAYLDALDPERRAIADRTRAVIRAAAPDATEAFRYQMPAVMFRDRYGLHYATWKKHLGLYPVGELPEPLASEVEPYRTQTDTVAFQYGDGVPFELIGRIAEALATKHRDASTDS